MKVTDTFAPFNHDDRQSERLAKRLGFSFYINLWGDLIELPVWDHAARKATAPELAMWAKLVPAEWVPKEGYTGGSVPVLRATDEEVLAALVAPGPITVNPEEAARIRAVGYGRNCFFPCLDRELLDRGRFGTWNDVSPVWVSRAIPVGYYWHGAFETVRPTRENGVLNVPDVDPVLEATILSELQTFSL
jgi:hypothetical protein